MVCRISSATKRRMEWLHNRVQFRYAFAFVLHKEHAARLCTDLQREPVED